MFKVLKQFQEDLKQIAILLSVPTDDWIKGYVSYVDQECVSLETEQKDGVYYTLIIKLEAIVAIEFVSDVRVPAQEKYEGFSLELKPLPFYEDEDEDGTANCI